MTDEKPADPQPPVKEPANRCLAMIDRSAARGHIMRDVDAFGASSPQWTIPSSRQEHVISTRSPGPTKYDVPRLGCVLLPGSPMSARRVTSDRTVTSNVDTPNIRVYPRTPRKTIGERQSLHFFEMTDAPDHFFNWKSDTFSKGSKIGKRCPIKGDDFPGPGDYSPAWPQTPRLASLGRCRDRRIWKVHEGPSPAEYHIVEPSKPKWRGAIRPIPKRIYTDE
jgi:hypothetical protein